MEISFWYDVWTPLGQLISYLSNSGPRNLRIPLQAKDAGTCDDFGWKLASPRSEGTLNLHAHLKMVRIPNSASPRDSYEWFTHGIGSKVFSTSRTWEAMRSHSNVKLWVDLIWFKCGILKHYFTMSIANYNRFPTRSRLVSRGLQVPKDCCLCSRFKETRDHLLLMCDYNLEV